MYSKGTVDTEIFEASFEGAVLAYYEALYKPGVDGPSTLMLYASDFADVADIPIPSPGWDGFGTSSIPAA